MRYLLAMILLTGCSEGPVTRVLFDWEWDWNVPTGLDGGLPADSEAGAGVDCGPEVPSTGLPSQANGRGKGRGPRVLLVRP